MIKQSILLANLLVAVGIAEGHGLSSAVNIGISSPTLHLNNSGDISVKGTSEVTVTDGVPEDKVNFSIEMVFYLQHLPPSTMKERQA